MNRFVVLMMLSTSLGLSACAVDPTDNASPGTADDDITVATLPGTWDNHGDDALPFYELVLNGDHTYAWRGGCRQDGAGPHCHAITASQGRWATARSGPQLGAPGGAKEIVLTDSLGQRSAYFYTLSGNELSLATRYGAGAVESVFDRQIPPPAGPVGTYVDNGADALPFYSFTFASDHTYVATGGCRPNPGGVHCNAITRATGTWSTVLSGPQLGAPGGAPEIVLVDSFNQTSTYFFSLTARSLTLATRYGAGATTSVFAKQ